MRILITGGAGFIGSHTVDAALAAGCAVRILDDLSTGSRDNVPAGAELVIGDVTDWEVVRGAAEGCDRFLHLAALVSAPESLAQPVKTFDVNAAATVNVLEAARQVGAQRFVLASTCAVYGDIPGRKDENSPIQLLSPYAASKFTSEQWTQLYTTAYGLDTVILRYFNVYGPRQHADSAYSCVLAKWCTLIRHEQPCTIYGDGQQTRDFISVHDIAAANLLVLTSDKVEPGTVYPVATGNSTSLNDVLDALDEAVGRPVLRNYAPVRAGDILHSAGDSSRLRKLGWQPNVSLVAGLSELLASGTD